MDKWVIKPDRYFDYAATCPMPESVLEETVRAYKARLSNPSSLHTAGYSAQEVLQQARERLAQGIGARPRELLFTGSGTEANNLAIIGAARRMRRLGRGNHLITAQIEHPSVLQAFKALLHEGFQVTFVPADSDGVVKVSSIEESIGSETILVSIMMVNNVIGTIQPVRKLGGILREKGILFHTDAAQALGKLPIDVNDLKVDLLSINGHKIGSAKGIGALYLRNGVRIDPLYYGGEQERRLRPATENIEGAVSFAAAWAWIEKRFEEEKERINKIRSLLLSELHRRIPQIRINGDPHQSIPNLINIAVPGIEGQALMLELDQMGFATSSASACSAHSFEPSYVLLAIDPSTEHALEGLRISMGWGTTEESVTALAEALEIAVKHWEKRT